MTTGAKPSPLARVIVAAGVVLFWGVQLALFLLVDMPLVDSILLAVLLAAVPVFSIAQLPMIEDAFVERLPAYWGSIVTLWLLGSACWLVGTRNGGAAAIGVVGIAPLALIGWSALLVALGLAAILIFRQIAIWWRIPDTPLLRQLLPRDNRERGVFALLSLAAGTGEEIAYRGYAIPMLIPITGPWGAALLTSAVFGVVHGYQGVLGILRTGIMGGVLAWGFIASGSLWPAVIAHTLIDLIAGIALGERLLSPVSPNGVDGDPDPTSEARHD